MFKKKITAVLLAFTLLFSMQAAPVYTFATDDAASQAKVTEEKNDIQADPGGLVENGVKSIDSENAPSDKKDTAGETSAKTPIPFFR